MSDTIYREDAIKVIKDNSFAPGVDYLEINGYGAIDDIRALPSADRPQGWIPCSERLPKIGEKVLVSTKKNVFTEVYKGFYSDPKRWAWENNSVKRIEAWQPLPKPWKGADDGK